MQPFDKLIATGTALGKIPAKTAEARNWYRQAAARTRTKIGIAQPRQAKTIVPGQVVLFEYDPKTKDTLPFYDRFPVVLPVEPATGGFYGLNFHYLPYTMRAQLLDALYKYATDDKYNEQTRINVSYQLLKRVRALKAFRPCFKRYLYSHLQTPLTIIAPAEWDIAIFLPVEKFVKKTTAQVHAVSKQMVTTRTPHVQRSVANIGDPSSGDSPE